MSALDAIRKKLSASISEEVKSAYGQYFTPDAIAEFMATLFSEENWSGADILDPGAGIGALSNAVVSRARTGRCEAISSVTMVELDSTILPYLGETKKRFVDFARQSEIIEGNFLEIALNWLQFEPQKRFSHIILNPPYKKIASNSLQRRLLRQAGIETVNLYSGFVALCILLLREGGELVAIIPRSFCNGPYYKSFRRLILEQTQILQIHLFESRKNNFRDDQVLQENVILKLRKMKPARHSVKISWATDLHFQDYREYDLSFDEVVKTDDEELFIRIPEKDTVAGDASMWWFQNTLQNLNLSVSTGPVVDFRAKPFLSAMPQAGTVPLIYPMHLHLSECHWPQANAKKSNSIFSNESTRKMFFSNGYYCVVKRFSAKEEARRIVASVVKPEDFPGVDFVGFENHLNIFHQSRNGLKREIAYGLMVFLNSKLVDRHFRSFNGHTQVNATDLRQIRYPSPAVLESLGNWALSQPVLNLENIDHQMEAIYAKEVSS